jgi:hypothetical protein
VPDPSNSEIGRRFQQVAIKALGVLVGVEFEDEVEISIGTPRKPHKFDLASADRRYVAECKAFTFTRTGNIPAAKLTTLKEAATYLLHLPDETKRFIVMKRSIRPTHPESLVEYFVRLHSNLLGDICVVEVSDDGEARLICGAWKTEGVGEDALHGRPTKGN